MPAVQGVARYQTLFDVYPDGVIVMDDHSVILAVNPAVERLLGYGTGELVGQPLSVLIPERLRESHRAGVERYLATGRRNIPWNGVELPALDRSGGEIPVEVSFGEYFEDGQHLFAGFVRDLSERKRAEARRDAEHDDLQRTSVALRESEERFRILAETIQEVLYVTSMHPFRMEYLSPAYERIWGRSVHGLKDDPRAYIDAIHPDDREAAREALRRQQRGEETSTEYRIVRPDGETRWILDRAFPVRDAAGRVARVTGSAADITARKRAEEAQRFLADASAVFAESLEPGRLLGRLAELAVPRLGDWCAIYAADGPVADAVAVAHQDPARSGLVRELARRYSIQVGEASGAGRTLATGEPQLYPEIPDELLVRRARDAAELELLRQLGLRSYLCVAFRAGGRQHALALAMSESGRRLGPEDLRLAQDLAHLFQEGQQARLAAERLQRVTAAVSEAVTLEQIGEAVMHHGIRAFGGDCGVLALVTEAGDELRIVASTGYPAEACMGPDRHWPLSAGIPIAEAARTGATVVVPSPEAWRERYGGGSSRSSSAAWVAIPVRHGPGQGGALLWTQTSPTDFSPEQIASMETVARLCGQAVERARLYEAERRARTEAEEANRAKTEFLSAMSHELRTPLNAIGGYVDLMEMGIRGPVSEQQRADLARIRVAQTALLSLINDILNFARIEAGRIEYRSEVVPVAPLLDEIASLVGPQVAAREIRYHCSPGGEGLAMRGDPERIRQIVLNLLSNAVKFTDRGGEIRLSARGAGRRVEIRVVDTGRGIAPDRLDDIFDPFVQLNRREVAESQQGVGLGLAISRELAHAMGGEITAESELGVGSTFTLRLPRADGSTAGG